MAIKIEHRNMDDRTKKYVGLTLVVAFAFVASYAYATSRTQSAPAAGLAPVGGTPPTASSGTAGGAAGGCCGSGSGATVKGDTKVAGGVQTIAIDMSTGSYSPNEVRAKAGIPIRITFGRSSGCTGRLLFPQFGIDVDLSSRQQTFDLPALKKGTYQWSCGMQMQSGRIVVE